MKRLTEILNWLTNNNISIDTIYYDDSSKSTLIAYDNSNKLIELSEHDFIFYDKDTVKRFSSIRTQEIILFLNGNL